jgi:hypothetical protein
MALTDSEVNRVRAELGYNLLSTGAEPWISSTQVFDQIIQPFLIDGASTTSSTAVTVATTPTPVTLTLVSGTGFSAFDRVAIDVDARLETPTIQSISGNSIVVALTKTHSGTYPVAVEGGSSIVRDILNRIAGVKTRMASAFGAGALKKVDEIEFHPNGTLTLFGSLGSELSYWREELAAVLGIPSNWSRMRRAGSVAAVY